MTVGPDLRQFSSTRCLAHLGEHVAGADDTARHGTARYGTARHGTLPGSGARGASCRDKVNPLVLGLASKPLKGRSSLKTRPEINSASHGKGSRHPHDVRTESLISQARHTVHGAHRVQVPYAPEPTSAPPSHTNGSFLSSLLLFTSI